MPPAGRALVLVVLVLVTAGCSLAGRTLGGYVDDTLVKGAVKRRLDDERVAGIRGVHVDTGLRTLPAAGSPIRRVSIVELPERPDRPGPHYAVILWHVGESGSAALR